MKTVAKLIENALDAVTSKKEIVVGQYIEVLVDDVQRAEVALKLCKERLEQAKELSVAELYEVIERERQEDSEMIVCSRTRLLR